MIHEEIQLKLEEISSLNNVCDMIIALKEFNIDYKKTDFYKQTKMSLEDLFTFYRKINPINLKKIFKEIQKHISELNLESLESLLENFNLSAIGSFKDLAEHKDLLEAIRGLSNL